MPHISVRKHICWDPNNGGKPSEPTSTIVLTTGDQGWYVDIRVFKADNDAAESFESKGDPSLENLDWAFAGTSGPVDKDRKPGDVPERLQWVHLVDSRHLTPGGGKPITDMGDCYPCANGDMLEKGEMEHPDTGIVTEYEELWGSIGIMSIRDGRTSQGGEKVSALVRTTDASHDDGSDAIAKGFVVRVGQFIQGIMITSGRMALERWTFTDRWQLQIRMGNSELKLPCSVLFDCSMLKDGDQVTAGGVKWQIEEMQKWIE